MEVRGVQYRIQAARNSIAVYANDNCIMSVHKSTVGFKFNSYSNRHVPMELMPELMEAMNVHLS